MKGLSKKIHHNPFISFNTTYEYTGRYERAVKYLHKLRKQIKTEAGLSYHVKTWLTAVL